MYQHHDYRNKKPGSVNRMNRKIVLPILTIIFILFFIYSIDLIIYRDRIYPHVIAMDQEIGRMVRIQAYQILNPVAVKMISEPMIIQYHDLEISVIPHENLGISIDVEQLINEAYSVARRGTFWNRLKERISLVRHSYHLSDFLVLNKNGFEEFFAQLQSQIEESPRNAVLDNNKIITAQEGVEIDRFKLIEEIQRTIIDSVNIEMSSNMIVPVHYQQPDLSTTELLASIGVKQTISTYETSLQGKDKNTLHNIQKASNQIHGIMLKPGESFSFNQIIGPAEKEDGYKESTIIANGKFINGYGGGVCQVSTTLYNAVLLASLQIIERYNHSIYGDATDYVPLGRDAAIFYGYKDLKFKNSLDQKIVIFCEIEEDTLAVTIFGEKALDKNITIISQDKKIHDYEIIKIKQENSNAFKNRILQEGISGYSIKTYRMIVDSKGEKMEFLSEDRYDSVPMKTLVD